jgi:hypothetical protein
MIVTILGSCRQETIKDIENITVTSIQDDVSFPHYSSEILEVIKFCKYGDISPEETTTVFRTPILQNKPIFLNSSIKRDFESTNIFVIEIASKKTYKFNGRFVHHILYDLEEHRDKYGHKIQIFDESDEEIEDNILLMKKELNRPILIVSHICTYNSGSRFDLTQTLEKICDKHNIPFLNPGKELLKRGYNVIDLLHEEERLGHYNDTGKSIIKDIYKDFLLSILG